MEIQKNLLTINSMSRPGTKIGIIKGVVVHYVCNPGSSALANRNYFESLKNQTAKYASSHYIIGLQGEIINCVPENEVAYHAVGANSNYIGIECCHPDASGKFNDKTYASLIELCADICKRYGLNPETALIRHWDATKTMCPLYYVNNPAAWDKIKADVSAKMYAQPLPPMPKDISEWAKESWKWAVENKVSDGTRPKDPITREEMWTMLHNCDSFKK